ncbi:MAG TPA: CatB-related O-acetyltransferase [Solirubrobacteraceae bacterium]|nr:CatB-related O-acetyltransferase [Solirubrobacteraceae bacterium]
MERGQALRILRRALVRTRTAIGDAGATDPVTGDIFGALTAEEAVAAGRASVGRHSYGSFQVNAGRSDRARLRIGAFCSIAWGVEFALGGNHRPDWVSTYPFRVMWDMPGAFVDGHPRAERDIEVGNDVWIGAQALILPGARIGDGAVIGARAVVAGEVRPYSIVGGIPARELRRRFSDKQIDSLLSLRWWEWPEERIKASVDLLCSPDVERLLAATRC